MVLLLNFGERMCDIRHEQLAVLHRWTSSFFCGDGIDVSYPPCKSCVWRNLVISWFRKLVDSSKQNVSIILCAMRRQSSSRTMRNKISMSAPENGVQIFLEILIRVCSNRLTNIAPSSTVSLPGTCESWCMWASLYPLTGRPKLHWEMLCWKTAVGFAKKLKLKGLIYDANYANSARRWLWQSPLAIVPQELP